MKKSDTPILWQTIEGFCLIPNKEYYVGYGIDGKQVRLATWNVKYKVFNYLSTQPSFCSHDHDIQLSDVKYIMDEFTPDSPDTGEWSGETNIHGLSTPTGIELIAIERQEQIEKHGYDADWVNDNPEYYEGKELAWVAEMALAVEHEEGLDPNIYPESWPTEDVDKILRNPYKERLIIAGALVAAEIDRLNSNNHGKE
jgi:hypothetical protein